MRRCLVLPVLLLVVAWTSMAEISQHCDNGVCTEDTENRYMHTAEDQDTSHTQHKEDVTLENQENDIPNQRVKKKSVKLYSYDAPVVEDEIVYQGEETTPDVLPSEKQEDRYENSDTVVPDTPVTTTEKDAYEFPPLVRLYPGELDDIKAIELEPGRMHMRITRALTPPVFQIPNFLSSHECDYIIKKAKEVGLGTSRMFGKEVPDPLKPGANLTDIPRVSSSTWVRPSHTSPVFTAKLTARLAKLTALPVDLILRSEPLQVVHYEPGGHYHAHLDSVETPNLPCCFLTDCGDKEKTTAWPECCRLCRFITVMYYLNDVDEGGETAFPLADMPDQLYKENMVNLQHQKWFNLSEYCYNSSLIVTPRKGTAIMWYTHFLDEKGYLGTVDKRSNHGGCDVIKGTKWIANSWISAPPYEDRFLPSQFYRK